jgi:hypothetical protein
LLQNYEEFHYILNDRNCVQQCEPGGIVGGITIPHCTNETIKGVWYTKEPLYTQWRQLNCTADFANVSRYHCMMQREQERRLQGLERPTCQVSWQMPLLASYFVYLCSSVHVSSHEVCTELDPRVDFLAKNVCLIIDFFI